MENKEQLAREARNAYQREWARKNRDKVKATQQRYWIKRAAQEIDKGGGEHGESNGKVEDA